MILTPGRFFAYYNVGTWVSENVELLCWTSNWEPMCRRCYLVQWSSEIIFNITIILMLMMMKVLNLPLPRCRLDRSLPRPCTHAFYSDIFFNTCCSTIYPMLKNIVPPTQAGNLPDPFSPLEALEKWGTLVINLILPLNPFIILNGFQLLRINRQVLNYV